MEINKLCNEQLNVLADIAGKKKNIALKDVNQYVSNNELVKSKQVMKNSKCINCEQGLCDRSCDKENILPTKYYHNGNVIKTTPQKIQKRIDPATPTTNLKMLVCAASVLAPAHSKIEGKKCQQSKNSIVTEEEDNSTVPQKLKLKKGELMGRKEKSLGLLCKKFMMIYPEYSPIGTTIMLDDVVQALNIGRRRVYDIVNVLESMEMMVRQAKNKYLWFGKSRLPATLTKLKALALRVYGPNFCLILQRFHHILGRNETSDTPEQSHSLKVEQDKTAPFNDVTNSIMDDIISYDFTKRESSRSLGILCQKFLMLFMVAEESVVTLDRAAKLLITEGDEGPAKYKTKVRRLYDIANILTSIKFLEKCVSYEEATKKAAYKWVGLDLKAISSGEDTNKAFESQEFSLTRHSLLSQIPRKHLDGTINQRKFQCRSVSAHQLTSPGTQLQNSGKIKFPRTFSASMVKNEETAEETIPDGFDVEKWSCDTSSPAATTGYQIDKPKQDSPNEMLFKEKLQSLQKEFPDKLPANRLLDLLSACGNQPKNRSLRRSLSSDFDAENGSPPDKKRKMVEENIEKKPGKSVNAEEYVKIAPQNTVNNNGPVYYAALKPLLSYVQPKSLEPTKPNSVSTIQSKQQGDEKWHQTGGKWQQPAYLTIPATFKQSVNPSTDAHTLSPMLVSPVGRPISIAKNGVYQIIPVQCRPYTENRDAAILQTINVPLVVNQQQPNAKSATLYPNQASSMMMRTPIVTVTSPSVMFSPKTLLRKIVTDPATVSSVGQQHNICENYTEFVTPPHVFIRGGKPQANPIIFPKMTPETPSTDSYPLLAAVTRKLMSLQGQEHS